jgi:hypothetical protein
MQVRGAKRHREGFDYAMFLAFRGMIVCQFVLHTSIMFRANISVSYPDSRSSGFW